MPLPALFPEHYVALSLTFASMYSPLCQPSFLFLSMSISLSLIGVWSEEVEEEQEEVFLDYGPLWFSEDMKDWRADREIESCDACLLAFEGLIRIFL